MSPHFPSSAFTGPLNVEQKIELFADSVRGWQLDVAEQLIASDPHSGLAVLSIVLSYFEMMGKYQDGYAAKGKSREYFSQGFRWVTHTIVTGNLGQLDKRLSMIYEQVRCGMYHDGITGPRIVLSGEIGQNVLQLRGEELRVNPQALVRALQVHFSRYIADLLAHPSGRARRNFLKRFDWRQEVGGGVGEGQ